MTMPLSVEPMLFFFLQSFLYSTRQQTYRKENKTCTTKRFVSHLYHQCLPTFQRNFETKVGNSYYGTLSYSLYKVLKEVNQWNRIYYPKIWEQAKSFSSKQIPMIESSYAL